MNKLLQCKLLLAFAFLACVNTTILWGQSGNCDPEVPFYRADLTGVPDSAYISPPDRRDGLCCGLTITAPPPRCIEFEVTLDQNAIGLNFDIHSGARPTGSLFYQVNCGPLIPIGQPICLNGTGPYTLTFCKPGNNPNEYAITSIANPISAVGDTTRAGCEATLKAYGFVDSTIVWQDITSPNGEYLSFLSCTEDCDSVIASPPQNAPAFVDYLVCGTPANGVCEDSTFILCDTVRLVITPPLEIGITPDPPVFCTYDLNRELALISNLPTTHFTYTWTKGPRGAGPIISTDSVHYASDTGYYSLIIEDTLYGTCSRDTAFAYVDFVPPPIVEAGPDTTICLGDVVQLHASGATFYEWDSLPVLSCLDCQEPWVFPNTTTTFWVTGLDIYGCLTRDSVTITVLPTFVTDLQVEICEGDSIFLGGAFQDTAGTYYDTLVAANGCDSTLITVLSILPTYYSTQQASICQGDSLFVGGGFQTLSGTYLDTLTAANGCDSIVQTELMVLPIATTTQQMSICQGDSLFIGGAFQTLSGTYADTLTAANGCDSIVQTELTILLPSFSNITEEICQGDSLLWNNQYYLLAGTYSDTLNTIMGCDSIIQLELNVLPSPDLMVIEDQTICRGDSVQLMASGADMYMWTPLTSLSCDDCASPIASPAQTTTYTVSTLDCRGLPISQDVTVFVNDPPEVSAGIDISIQEGEKTTLTASGNGTSPLIYSWYDPSGLICENCQEIEVAPKIPTTYRVILTDVNSCTALDEVLIDIEERCTIGKIEIPNIISPNGDGANDVFYIKAEQPENVKLIRIYNRWGQLVFESNHPDIQWDGTFNHQACNPGVFAYYVELICEEKQKSLVSGNITLIR